MKILVTSPRKRMGQTITSINLAATVSKLLRSETLIIDFNQRMRDIEYYLSDTALTKGLDDFFSLLQSNLLNKKSFGTCVKKVHEFIDMMAASECFELKKREFEHLFDCVDDRYRVTVIDGIYNESLSSQLFSTCDVVIIVINQDKNAAQYVESHKYKKFKEKVVFVVNRHSQKIEGVKIQYDLEDITKDLKEIGFDNPVFPLDYDPVLINECNDRTVLNYILNGQYRNKPHVRQMEDIAKYIFKMGDVEEHIIQTGNLIESLFFNRYSMGETEKANHAYDS